MAYSKALLTLKIGGLCFRMTVGTCLASWQLLDQTSKRLQIKKTPAQRLLAKQFAKLSRSARLSLCRDRNRTKFHPTNKPAMIQSQTNADSLDCPSSLMVISMLSAACFP